MSAGSWQLSPHCCGVCIRSLPAGSLFKMEFCCVARTTCGTPFLAEIATLGLWWKEAGLGWASSNGGEPGLQLLLCASWLHGESYVFCALQHLIGSRLWFAVAACAMVSALSYGLLCHSTVCPVSRLWHILTRTLRPKLGAASFCLTVADTVVLTGCGSYMFCMDGTAQHGNPCQASLRKGCCGAGWNPVNRVLPSAVLCCAMLVCAFSCPSVLTWHVR